MKKESNQLELIEKDEIEILMNSIRKSIDKLNAKEAELELIYKSLKESKNETK